MRLLRILKVGRTCKPLHFSFQLCYFYIAIEILFSLNHILLQVFDLVLNRKHMDSVGRKKLLVYILFDGIDEIVVNESIKKRERGFVYLPS